MRHALSLLLLLGSSSLVAAPDNAAEQAKARQDIQGLLGRLASAEKTGDASAVAQCYETDAWFLPSSGEPVKGREDITRRYQAIFAGKTHGDAWEIHSLVWNSAAAAK